MNSALSSAVVIGLLTGFSANAFVNTDVIAVFQARAATTPKAALAREIIVATNSLLNREVFRATSPTMGIVSWALRASLPLSASGEPPAPVVSSFMDASPPSAVLWRRIYPGLLVLTPGARGL